jgi:dipeptidyl aminopeptidase/acylaminoacyl peptidase
LPPLIPREVLFGNPDKANPRISPDGKRLAYVAPDEGVLNVWVRTVGLTDDHAVTKDRKQGIRAHAWAPNNEQILYVQDKDGDENWHLYAVDLKTNDVKDLTPFEGVQARVIALEPSFPDETLVGINKRDAKLHDVYRINIRTAEMVLEVENDAGFAGWVADHELKVRAATKSTPTGGIELAVREGQDTRWRTLITWEPQDVINSDPVAFTPDGKGLYILSSADGNTGELREIELATGKEKTLASDRQADVADVFIHPTKHVIQAVGFNKERIHWRVLDQSVEEDFRTLERVRRGDFRVLNRDNADRTWLVEYNTDDGPVSYYAYDRESRKAELLSTNRKALEGLRLAKMAPIGFKSRDGLSIPGYLTTPPGIPAKDLPMVVLVHGGPWSRDSWGYNGVAQWLANRGYAVLHVNFRGSTGYGKDFVNASTREWGGKMHEDLIDGVNWAVGRRIADPKRIAIFGNSFGGYAALAGVTFTPDVFCCAVDICGPSNLVTFINTLPPYIKPFEPLIWDRIGHPERDAEFLKSRSPLFAVDRITKPLLIGQGANDPRVKKSESLQIVEALRTAGKQVEYVEYPDEGHGFERPENRLDFYAKAEKFLAQHLGGRYQE